VKCLNKRFFSLALILILALSISGCGGNDISIPYGTLESNEDFNFVDSGQNQNIGLFAEDLCAADGDITDSSTINFSDVYAAAVYDVTSNQVLYSYNANIKINPASVTKIMTALIVLERCDLEATVKVDDVTINESGIQLFKLNEGDSINVRDLLTVMMVYSGNDCALAFAKYIAGSEEAFVDIMNEKAVELGCTGTHFSNCMGITDEDHYTTAYDLYLIFNEVIKYDEFITIINMPEYTCSYTSASGEYITRTVASTNKFLTGEYTKPSNVTVIGGKTGTTNAAGKCLILYSKDTNGNGYISIIMGAEDEQELYTMMAQLCNETIY